VLDDELSHRVPAQLVPAGAGEVRLAGRSGSFAEPCAQDRHGVARERDGSFVASLAEDLDVRAAAESDGGGARRGQLRYPQAGRLEVTTVEARRYPSQNPVPICSYPVPQRALHRSSGSRLMTHSSVSRCA
jgi:hypothetical protein